MKKTRIILVVGVLCTLLPLTGQARLFTAYTDPSPLQDDWILEGEAHELGIGFPPTQLISATDLGVDSYIPCPADYLGGVNFRVRITNLTGRDWADVYYVADPDTGLTNMDELVGEMPNLTPGLAFKIDASGLNTPLVSESITADGIFQAGEIWEFIIQEFTSAWAGSPAALDSPGVAGVSGSGPTSTGSIVAVPEPSTVALLGIASLVLGVARRTYYGKK